MVKLVGHALLLCCICLDVNNISDTVGNQKCRNFDVTMFCEGQVSFYTQCANVKYTFETPLEHMTRTRPVTERVRHFEDTA